MTHVALVVTPILIGLTAFFVLAEFSAVRVRVTQLEALEKTDPRALQALRVHHELGRHLSGIQVGITLLTIAVGATGEEPLVHWFHALFGTALPWPRAGLLLGTALGFLLITVMQVVLAELVPRGIAIRQATTWALRTAAPLLLWSKIVRPFTWILQKLSRGVVWLFGMSFADELDDTNLPSEEELRRMLERSQESGQLGLSKVELIDNLFGFSKRTIKEIAIPRTQVVCFDANDTLEANLVLARSSPHTRIPLVDGDLDRVIGIVHLKELLWALHEHGGEVDIREFARPAFLVPEMKLIQDLLLEFQRQKQHLALMVNEHGGVDGLVTLEDVLEELVGEIQDEFDRETIQLRKLHSGAWLAQGSVTLEQLVDHLGLDLAVEEGSISLGGYFQEQLGRVLRVGDELKIQGWRIRVLDMRGLAPSQFLLKPLKNAPGDGNGRSLAEPPGD
ncbi:MAG: HlyC/CorC family transporter [Acidobacteriota bacterium]|nr:HlyC/CorC family transporter [Acidobacteriota bacterium]